MNRRLCQKERERSLLLEAGPTELGGGAAGLWGPGAVAGVGPRVTFSGGDSKEFRVVSVGDDPRKVCPGQGRGQALSLTTGVSDMLTRQRGQVRFGRSDVSLVDQVS